MRRPPPAPASGGLGRQLPLLLLAAAAALLATRPHLAAAQPTAAAAAGSGPHVLISEFLASPPNTNASASAPAPAPGAVVALPGAAPSAPQSDWVELLNPGSSPVSLEGWTLEAGTGAKADRWKLPAAELPAGGYLVLLDGKAGAAGGAAATAAVVEGAGSIKLLPIDGFKLSKGGDPLTLLRPDGGTASATGAVVHQLEGVSFGLPAGAQAAEAAGPPQYTFLQQPTPGAPNSAARPAGPFIFRSVCVAVLTLLDIYAGANARLLFKLPPSFTPHASTQKPNRPQRQARARRPHPSRPRPGRYSPHRPQQRRGGPSGKPGVARQLRSGADGGDGGRSRGGRWCEG
jgi:hypothetical protein